MRSARLLRFTRFRHRSTDPRPSRGSVGPLAPSALRASVPSGPTDPPEPSPPSATPPAPRTDHARGRRPQPTVRPQTLPAQPTAPTPRGGAFSLLKSGTFSAPVDTPRHPSTGREKWTLSGSGAEGRTGTGPGPALAGRGVPQPRQPSGTGGPRRGRGAPDPAGPDLLPRPPLRPPGRPPPRPRGAAGNHGPPAGPPSGRSPSRCADRCRVVCRAEGGEEPPPAGADGGCAPPPSASRSGLPIHRSLPERRRLRQFLSMAVADGVPFLQAFGPFRQHDIGVVGIVRLRRHLDPTASGSGSGLGDHCPPVESTRRPPLCLAAISDPCQDFRRGRLQPIHRPPGRPWITEHFHTELAASALASIAA